jgi:hypothetical protein
MEHAKCLISICADEKKKILHAQGAFDGLLDSIQVDDAVLE